MNKASEKEIHRLVYIAKENLKSRKFKNYN